MRSMPLLPQGSSDTPADSMINQINTYQGEISNLDLIRTIIRNQLLESANEEELYRFIKELIETLGDYLELLYEERLSRATAIPR